MVEAEEALCGVSRHYFRLFRGSFLCLFVCLFVLVSCYRVEIRKQQKGPKAPFSAAELPKGSSQFVYSMALSLFLSFVRFSSVHNQLVCNLVVAVVVVVVVVLHVRAAHTAQHQKHHQHSTNQLHLSLFLSSFSSFSFGYFFTLFVEDGLRLARGPYILMSAV